MSAPGEAGRPRRGVHLRGGTAEVNAYSSIATGVDLCLFDEHGGESRVALEPAGGGEWSCSVAGVGVDQTYGFRVDGPFDPARGQWCDHAKLLVDPAARAIDGELRRDPSLRALGVDTAPWVPRSVVVDDTFGWGDDVAPNRPWSETVVYEVHVRGATMRHPGVPPSIRGTYLGIAHEAFVGHLVGLGVTAVELLPVFEWADEPFLAGLGLTNYWGYNPIGWFAPTARFATPRGPSAAATRQVGEFKTMVKALHAAGLEVVLDVVYNHTAEGGAEGETLWLKGFDAPAYYRLGDDGTFLDTTGCGNSINASSDAATKLVVDSLRYWAEACHVDGFRFDLAPTLARIDGRFDPCAPILQGCALDPVLSSRKMIAEPWDAAGDGGVVLGGFGQPFREWNGEFRATVRDFWRGEHGALGVLATRLAGSSDLFGPERPLTSTINFVTCHDGMTLRDLVSFDHKHNERNGQDGRDGTDDNRSRNWGAEGATDDDWIERRRDAVARAMLATLVLARGVPMVLGGDELGRTQQGNNNAYCQDNEVSWFDWERADPNLRAYVAALGAVRRDAQGLLGDEAIQPSWMAPSGDPMQWWDGREVAMWLEDRAKGAVGILVNGSDEEVRFELAERAGDTALVLSSTYGDVTARIEGDAAVVPGWSVAVLRRYGGDQPR